MNFAIHIHDFKLRKSVVPLCVVFSLAAVDSAANDGTAIGRLAETMQPGTWAELSTIGADAAFSASNSIFEYSDEMVWDSVQKRIYFIGTSDPLTDGKFIEYRASDNTWYINPNPPFLGNSVAHAYDHHAINSSDNKLFYRAFGGNNRDFWEYNTATRSWSQKADIAGISYTQGASAMTYFPERGTVIFYSGDVDSTGGGLTEFTPGTNSWSSIPGKFSPLGRLHSIIECNPIHGVCWFGGGTESNQMWRLNSDGSTVALRPVPIANIEQIRGTIVTVDPVTGDFLILTAESGFWKFDIMNDTWEELPGSDKVPMFVNPPNRDPTFHAVATPMSNYGVVMLAQWRESGSKVWLYKHGQQTETDPPTGGTKTFNELCKKGADGFPTDPNIVNCWGFESESEIFYHDRNDDTCANTDSFLANHVNGHRNGSPGANASVNTQTCLYPKIDNSISTSGNGSLRIIQVDDPLGDDNSAGTFYPYMRQYRDANGVWKHDAFGRGGEFWVHWRYRQDAGLFNYGAKRFMVTEHGSSFEQVLTAFADANMKFPAAPGEPYKYICSYSMKGQHGHGCSSTKFYEANKWHKIEMHVKVPSALGANDGIYEVFVDGERVIHSTDATSIDRGIDINEPYVVGLDNATTYANQTYAYFRLDFLLFENGKFQHNPPRPQGSMWIDDIVVSRTRIANLVESGTITPKPPTRLDTQ
jgi:hypothetical protein